MGKYMDITWVASLNVPVCH